MSLRRARRRVALGLALALAGAAGAAPADVRGRVTLDLPGTSLAELGPVVVYLSGPTAKVPAAIPSVHQKDARFSPGFLAIAAGQSVAMPNDDRIFHNVFSYSKPNDFDLGLYASGQSRTVTLRHPGVVRLYCAIHESMNGTIFVSPSPWFAVAAPDGSFAIAGAPPGRHLLRTWNVRLPDTERPIEVPPGGEIAVQVPLVSAD
jgi:plastocyanin